MAHGLDCGVQVAQSRPLNTVIKLHVSNSTPVTVPRPRLSTSIPATATRDTRLEPTVCAPESAARRGAFMAPVTAHWSKFIGKLDEGFVRRGVQY